MASRLRSTAQSTRRTAKRQHAALSYLGVYRASLEGQALVSTALAQVLGDAYA